MASAIGGIIGGFSKISEGKRMKREGRKGIAGFEWEELTNPYDSLAVSTMGSDLRSEEAARLGATSVEALRGAGTRGLIGGLGKVQAQSNTINKEIAAGLDEQRKVLDMAAAGDDVRTRNMTEKRQSDELAGYGNLVNQGRQTQSQGFGNIVGGLGSLESTALNAFGGVRGILGGAKGNG